METRPAGNRGGRAIRQIRVTGGSGSVRGERCAIGSHPSNDLVIDDPTVSRFHCEVTVAGTAVRVRDLGSRNGTVASGIGIVDATVPPGTVLVLGHAQVRIDVDVVETDAPEPQAFGTLVGTSPVMRALYAELEKVAASDAAVLIEGETGTGKEAIAEAIHEASARASGPFVIGDDAEAAVGGTLFVDEVGDLPAAVQQRLARARADVRVIAATSRDLRADVNRGTFRADLYYRIGVVKIDVPPLRARTGDVPMLVDSMVRALGAPPAMVAALTDPAYLAALAAAPWPGNVRELRNHLEECIVFGDARLPGDQAPHPSASVDASLPYELARKQAIDNFERDYVTALLARSDDNVAAAARTAGINRAYLHRLLQRHGLR